jgi:hypothetical protein
MPGDAFSGRRPPGDLLGLAGIGKVHDGQVRRSVVKHGRIGEEFGGVAPEVELVCGAHQSRGAQGLGRGAVRDVVGQQASCRRQVTRHQEIQIRHRSQLNGRGPPRKFEELENGWFSGVRYIHDGDC